MTDRDVLAAALAEIEGNRLRYDFEVSVIVAAARERLAQLPEQCPHGQDEPHGPYFHGTQCPGKKYPPAVVERIADALRQAWHPDSDFADDAVAVIDALNETGTP